MKKTTLALLIIIVVAAFSRFFQINTNPKAMYGDGLTAVYDAYSIFKTGHDQKGEFLPLVFSLGGGRPAGYVYATVPFVAVLGPTQLASVLVSVLSGLGIVLLLYFLGKELLTPKIGLAIAAMAALNPWELSLSRGPYETHLALFFSLLGVYSFIKGLKQKYWLIIFALSFGLALQTYSTYKLTIPLLTVLLLIWGWQKADFKKYLLKPMVFFSLAIIIFSALLGVYLTLSRGKEDRFDIINIFKDQTLRSTISQKTKAERLLDSLNPTISYKLHTPQVELAGVWLENYLGNLLPNFLFLHGDGQVRHNPAELGEFFWIDALLLIIGIIYLYKSHKQLLLLLIGWILITPLPTSLVGGPHALRSSLLLPPLLILIGVGLERLWLTRDKPINRIVLMTLTTIFIFQFIYFVDRFYFVAPQKNARAWSYPAKEAFLLAAKNKQKFDFVILSNNIDNMEFAYPAYGKLDPNLVIKQDTSPFKIGEFKFFKYENIYIGSLPNTRIIQFIKDLPGSVLYIGPAQEEKYLENYKIVRGFDKEPDLIITAKAGTPDLFISN